VFLFYFLGLGNIKSDKFTIHRVSLVHFLSVCHWLACFI